MNNKKIYILIVLVVICMIGLIVGSVAYYQKIVSGSLTTNTGKAIFVLKDSDGTVWSNKVIELGEVNPGDSGSFDIVMDASGSDVDMYATLELERNNLPTNLKFYTNPDHKSQLNKRYTLLEKTGNTVSSFTVYWYWNPYVDDLEDSKYINKSLNVTIKVNAIQISEYATMKNGYSYDSSANGGTEFWNNNYKPYIRTIDFSNDLSNLPSTCTEENLCWDISESSTQKNKVYGYLVDTGLKDDTDNTKPLYDLYIVSEAPIFAPAYCEQLFGYFKKLIQINFNDNFNTTNVTNMFQIFVNCSSLTNLDLSNFNTINVTNMGSMFNYCPSLTSLDLSSFNTANVTTMSSMFLNCSSLTNLDLNNFNTINVTNMGGMFKYCSSLTSLDLSSFNTSKVTNMGGMFEWCSSLTNLDLSNFNTANVTDMSYMLSSCESLSSLNISNFNTLNLTTMSSMFSNCLSLTNLDLSNFNTINVTNMSSMFSSCKALTSLDLSSFNTTKVTSMSQMFSKCSSLTNLDLSNFNTVNVTNMGGMFESCSSLEKLNLSNFNTSKVEIYYQYSNSIFQLCRKLQTEITIMNPNVTEENYKNMFDRAATDPNTKIIVNYTSETETLVDNMIKTKSSNSNVVKGILK